MPWLSEEPGWDEATDQATEESDEDEPRRLRVLAESLGLRFPDSEDPDYFE